MGDVMVDTINTTEPSAPPSFNRHRTLVLPSDWLEHVEASGLGRVTTIYVCFPELLWTVVGHTEQFFTDLS